MADSVRELGAQPIEKLPISVDAKNALRDIQSEVADAYRESFLEMVGALKRQASAIDRIQNTLGVLVECLIPHFGGKLDHVPPAFRVAGDGETSDVASTLVVSDPIATGFTLSQSDLAKALGINAADVSILVKAFALTEDGQCAVVVRRGGTKNKEWVNYHARAIARFREHLASPPSQLTPGQKQALRRATKKLLVSPAASHT